MQPHAKGSLRRAENQDTETSVKNHTLAEELTGFFDPSHKQLEVKRLQTDIFWYDTTEPCQHLEDLAELLCLCSAQYAAV